MITFEITLDSWLISTGNMQHVVAYTIYGV